MARLLLLVLSILGAGLVASSAASEQQLEGQILAAIKEQFQGRLMSDNCRLYFRYYAADLRNWKVDGDTAKVEMAFSVKYTSGRALYGTSPTAVECLGRKEREAFFVRDETYQSAVFLYRLSKWALGWHVDSVGRSASDDGWVEDAPLSLQATTTDRKPDAVELYNRGYAQFAHGDFEGAINSYSAAIAADPKLGVAYNNRCLTLVVLNRDVPRARQDCQRAVELLPKRADIRETLGFVHLRLNEPVQAIAEYNEALSIAPGRANALYGRGMAKQKLGDLRGAKADKQAAMNLSPAIESVFGNYGFWW